MFETHLNNWSGNRKREHWQQIPVVPHEGVPEVLYIKQKRGAYRNCVCDIFPPFAPRPILFFETFKSSNMLQSQIAKKTWDGWLRQAVTLLGHCACLSQSDICVFLLYIRIHDLNFPSHWFKHAVRKDMQSHATHQSKKSKYRTVLSNLAKLLSRQLQQSVEGHWVLALDDIQWNVPGHRKCPITKDATNLWYELAIHSKLRHVQSFECEAPWFWWQVCHYLDGLWAY